MVRVDYQFILQDKLGLTLFRPMEFSIKFDTAKLGLSIIHVYIEGSHGISFKTCIFSLKIDFVLTSSADPDEMPH